jgi:hypothetical protein
VTRSKVANQLRKVLGASWRARVVLAAMAIVFLAATLALRMAELETSVTIETTQNSTAAVPTPSEPESAGRPGSPPSSSTSTKTTTVRGTGSDALELGLIGFATLLALMAIFYDRLSEISGPGFGIKLAPTQKRDASEAVARRTRARVQQPAATASLRPLEWPALRQQPAMFRLAMMASSAAPQQTDAVLDATQEVVEQSSQATLRTIDYAESLLRLAQTSPESLRAVAEAWGIPEAEWLPLMTGTIPTGLWDRLADRALTEAGVRQPEAQVPPAVG